MTLEFDFNIAFKLDELTSSTAKKVEEFIEQIECYHDALSETGRATLVKFIIKSKIKGEAKTRLGQCSTTSFAELKTQILAKVLANETSEEISRKIYMATQGKKSLVDYARQLEDLSTRLASASLKETPTLNVATTKLNCAKLTLAQFKQGCHNEYKVILAAGRPQTLDDAVALASSAPIQSTEDVFYAGNYRKQPNFNRRGTYNRNANYNRTRNNRYFYNQGQNFNNQNQHFNSRRNNQPFNNNIRRRNFNQSNKHNNYNRTNSNRFHNNTRGNYRRNNQQVNTVSSANGNFQPQQNNNSTNNGMFNNIHTLEN